MPGAQCRNYCGGSRDVMYREHFQVRLVMILMHPEILVGTYTPVMFIDLFYFLRKDADAASPTSTKHYFLLPDLVCGRYYVGGS